MGKPNITDALATSVAIRVCTSEGHKWESQSEGVKAGMRHSARMFLTAYVELTTPAEPFGWWVETQGEKPDDTTTQFVRDPKFIETLQSRGLETAVLPLFSYVHEWDIHIELEGVARERQQLRNALAAMVGSGDADELRGMELAMRELPAPAEDKAVTINAIHALIATAPAAEVSHG